MSEASTLLEQALENIPGPVLLVLDPELPEPPSEIATQASVYRLGNPSPAQRFDSVVLVTPDVAALRRAASLLGGLRRARMLVCLVLDTTAVVPYAPLPGWPRVVAVEAKMVDGAALTRVRLGDGDRIRADWGFGVMARSAAVPLLSGPAGVRVTLPRVEQAPPVDLSVSEEHQGDDERPTDVLLSDVGQAPEVSVVTGRAPVVVLDAGTPLDEGIYHPVGFRRVPKGPVVDLPAGAPLTPRLARELRSQRGVRVPADADPVLLAGLAMSGVALLGEMFDVAEAALDDDIAREEYSIRLRRAALREHASTAWRSRLGERVGVRAAGYPTVSVLLATRRPEMLRHALAQVARQRLDLPGAAVELVLATHGFTADPGVVAECLGALPHHIVSVPADALFGDVLRAATDAASGQVLLKMDDDDWYGPEVVADLLLARRYSGAAVVGMPAEQVYLEPVDTTVRRKGPSENYGGVVAGGTLMVDRTLLREIGGFRRVRRFVDAQLLDSARKAGALVYRTHGLGYVLRRTDGGHTWDPGVDYFLRPESIISRTEGFAPSALLEHP